MVVTLCWCMLPVVGYLVVSGIQRSAPSLKLTLWLLAFVGFQALMVWAAFYTWTYAGDRASDLDALLPSGDHGPVVLWLERMLAPVRQWSFCLLVVATGLTYLAFRQEDLMTVVPVNWASYVSFGITMFLGANVLYWLWVAPRLLWVMTKHGRLVLRWYDPASTPGIRLFADALSVAGLFLVTAAAGVSVLAILIDRDGGLLPASIVTLLFFMTGLVLATGLRVFLPFLWSYVEVRAQKREVQAELASTILWKPSDGGKPPEDEERAITLHAQIGATPNLPFSTASVIQYTGVVVGSVLAYAGAWLLK